ncbi:phosphatidylinositol mannoside acyltransferase [Enemella evansiae]|nr:phosphatidylinositol mannoside acyltransferase [Enemella evansiae]
MAAAVPAAPVSTRWTRFRDAANRQIFQRGQAIAPHLSARAIDRVAAAAAYPAERLDWSHLRTYRENLTRTLGHPPNRSLVRAGIASWLRNFVEVLALQRWSRERIVGSVTVLGEDRLRAAHADRGAVVALAHLANWDLAGAWACSTGLPVSTVAENLGAREFEAYKRIRAHLGMEVLAHDDTGALRRLTRAIGEGRVVCLLAERDFTRAGIEVDWAGNTVRMPAGPAMIARTTGAALFGAVTHYVPGGIVLELTEIEHRPGREGLAAMTQDLADQFVTGIRAYPQDWHMMQPFFDLPARGPAR